MAVWAEQVQQLAGSATDPGEAPGASLIESGVHMACPTQTGFQDGEDCTSGGSAGDLVSEEDPRGFLQAMPRARPGHLWVSHLAL